MYNQQKKNQPNKPSQGNNNKFFKKPGQNKVNENKKPHQPQQPKKENFGFDKNLVVHLGESAKRKQRLTDKIKYKVQERADNFKAFQKDDSGDYRVDLNEFDDELNEMKTQQRDKQLISESIQRLELVTEQPIIDEILKELKRLESTY